MALTRAGIATMNLERYYPELPVKEVELAKIPIGVEDPSEQSVAAETRGGPNRRRVQ